jgi:GDP-4-dehydro-6-deoxy-D-mannose reductase
VPASAIPVTEDQPLRPLHPYGISKLCLDLLARQYFADFQVPTVNVRLFNTTGPGKTNDAPSDFVRQLIRIKKGKQEPVIEVGNLKPHRALLDVDDAVRGLYLAALKGTHGEVYNLCAEHTHRIREILNMAIQLAAVEVDVRPVTRLMRPSDEKIIFGSTKKIRRDTGWKPLRSLEETLRSMLEYWKKVL